MKYSIIMPYHKKRMLYNTLLSFRHHYEGRHDYEVLIMEDCKNTGRDHVALMEMRDEFIYDIDIQLLFTNFPNCYAPSKMFNLGVSESQGKYVVLTSPECFHMTNVLEGFDRELLMNPTAYIVAACFSTDDTNIVAGFSGFQPRRKIWLQHSKILNRGLYWCSVLSKAQYNKVGGIDEGYAPGFGREDIDFVRTLKAKGVKVIAKDDILVVHQNHPDCSPRKRELWKRNAQYYNKKWRGK